MKDFFKVMEVESVLTLKKQFAVMETENIGLDQACGRVLAQDVTPDVDIPGFQRSTMDGFAVQAASTFGASEGNPAYLTIVGSVTMGQQPEFRIEAGQAAHIATGGMLPLGADSVIMVEHTDTMDDATLEAYRSVAPGQHVVAKDEDLACSEIALTKGRKITPADIGTLAACGCIAPQVFRRPTVAIISTGDEVVPMDQKPRPGQIRDINTHTLAALVRQAGAEPHSYGIIGDHYTDLQNACNQALAQTNMVLISGGSSVGRLDLTIQVLETLPQSRILVHGVAIKPGKPTILAQCGTKAVWGLPGHVASAMIVFSVLVASFLAHISGQTSSKKPCATVKARLARNLASVQGRVDYVRVRLTQKENTIWAEPILGKSGLIHTMAQADGLVAIGLNSEGLDQGTVVDVVLMNA